MFGGWCFGNVVEDKLWGREMERAFVNHRRLGDSFSRKEQRSRCRRALRVLLVLKDFRFMYHVKKYPQLLHLTEASYRYPQFGMRYKKRRQAS